MKAGLVPIKCGNSL